MPSRVERVPLKLGYYAFYLSSNVSIQMTVRDTLPNLVLDLLQEVDGAVLINKDA